MLAVEPQLGRQAIEPSQQVSAAAAELDVTDDRRDTELPLAGQWLRVDDEPGLTLGGENVVAVEILVEQHLPRL